MEMAEYHVGCGLFGIYAGTLNKKGDMWINKSDVTEEVLDSTFQYLFTNEKVFIAKVKDKEYVMKIEEKESK